MSNDFNNDEVRIVMADDHEVVRAGVRRMLSMDKSIHILDEADNGKNLIEIIKYHKPDLAVVDIFMPVMNGIEAVKEIRKQNLGCYVLMLTAFEDSNHLEQAINAGADGYLSKDIGAKELINAIKTVVHGERVFSKSIVKLLQRKYIPESDYDASPITITKREQEILNLVALGKKSSEIADALDISVRTVESHRYNLMNKLDVSNAAGLVRYAVIHNTLD